MNLNLGSNRLSSFHSPHNPGLTTLELGSNRFVEIPTNLPKKLSTLDMSAQNANLTELKNYQFDIVNTDYYYRFLEVYIERNDFTQFGTKVFCPSRVAMNVSELTIIYELRIDYDVALRVDKCLWRQWGVRNDNRTIGNNKYRLKIVNSGQRANLSEFCNCDMFNYLQQFNIELQGDCVGVFNNETCFNESSRPLIDDGCELKDEFKCNFNQDTTTMTSTSSISSGTGTLSFSSTTLSTSTSSITSQLSISSSPTMTSPSSSLALTTEESSPSSSSISTTSSTLSLSSSSITSPLSLTTSENWAHSNFHYSSSARFLIYLKFFAFILFIVSLIY